ncbi:MAG: glycosyltransferase [Alteraurantiacibacter sp.]
MPVANPLSIGIVTPTVSRAGGGIFPIVLAHARELVEQGHAVTVYGLDDDPARLDRHDWTGISAQLYDAGRFGHAPRLAQDIMASNHDLLHQHGVWMYLSIAVSKWRARTGKPVVISTQGMLEPWALSNSAWKKALAGVLYERRNVRLASAIHCSQAELAGVRAYAPQATVAVLPNGTQLPEEVEIAKLPREGKRSLLFFGRLHPKKGVAELIRAWAILREDNAAAFSEWQLQIVGWDDGGHEAEYKALALDLGLGEGDIAFPGPQFGQDKARLLSKVDAFILPSYSEGFPMAVLEAWSYKLPVFMTRECNITQGFAARAAIEISNEPRELAATLGAQLSSTAELTQIGLNGRRLVEEVYSWPRVVSDLAHAYRWLVNGGTPPDCIDIAGNPA